MTTAVVAMAYGSPATPDDIEAYYTDIRRGRPPSTSQLAELESRYVAIGGLSPLNERATAQVAALQRALDAQNPGRYEVLYAAKHAPPRIEDAIEQAAKNGATSLVGIVLAPHYSSLSVGEYLERAGQTAEILGLGFAAVRHYGADDALVELLSNRVLTTTAALEASARGPFEVLFSAHSLPARALGPDDPYAAEIAETAALVAARAGLSRWRTCWQSAGATIDEWLGPDIGEVITSLPAEGVGGVVVCPVGFVSDHLEILYDLDIVAARRAQKFGLAFGRTASLNDDPDFAALLARLVAAASDGLPE